MNSINNFEPEKLKNYHNNLLLLPLGGTNEIGINVTLYHYKGKWLMIDCGGGFADDNTPGIDILVPDLSFIEKHKKDIVALVLTHAHEDHLGSIQYLWPNLKCPIYATPFTANFLKVKLQEFSFREEVEITVVDQGSKIDLDPFIVEMVPLTHSAPEMQAIVIRTPEGDVLHTGDWKFDHDPLVGEAADEELLKQYGKNGILAMVCDSTNVFTQEKSGSEGDLRKSLVELIKQCPKLVVVTTFASNIARIMTLVYAAQQSGRKIIVAGKSIERILQAAKASNYLNDIDTSCFVNKKDFKSHKREKILVIATGCQGETMAAISKMATEEHPIKLEQEDTIIFSSKIIPGNDKRLFKLFNIFVRKKIEVITEKDHFVHVSGHPGIEELRKMYDLVKPKIAIPVHGEAMHIHEHAKLARKFGINLALEPENGTLINLSGSNPGILGKVHSGYLGVDGDRLVPITSRIFSDRIRLKENGAAFINVFCNKSHIIHFNIATPGIFDFNDTEDMRIRGEIIQEIKHKFEKQLKDPTLKNPKGPKNVAENEALKKTVRDIFKRFTGKRPVVITNISWQ